MARGVRVPAGLKILNGRGPGLDGRPRDSGGRVISTPRPFRRLAPEKPRSLTRLAAEHWDEIVPELARLELLTPAQVGGLVIICEVWARITRARELLKGNIVSENSQGRVQSPILVALRADEKLYLILAAHFGLTPTSESQLKARDAVDDGDSPFA